MRVLLIGKGSFLARAVLGERSEGLSFVPVSHSAEFDSIDLDSYDTVVNMAYDPAWLTQPYDEAADFDLMVVKRLVRTRAHYVMMSSRRVYGQGAPFHITEEYRPDPSDHYGRNKLRTERAVQGALADRCTILRVGNVFGFEPGRRSFFGIALKSLKQNNQILLDVSPFVSRDFIHIDAFAEMLRRVLLKRPSGVFNLGTGRATELGRIALWIIEGYQQGNLIVSSPVERDSFQLDINKLTSCIGLLNSPSDIQERCKEIGRKLRDA